MARTAIATDSNSGITQSQAKELGVFVLPMPFFMRGKIQFEDIDLTQEQFYEILAEDAAVSTSQPSPGDLMDFWNKILEEYDDIVYIPMSSGLSTSCDTATVLSEDYEGKVQVVNNQRISVTQQQSVLDAKKMANRGVAAKDIKAILEEDALDASIYIMVDTLKYLKKGGRVTAAGAAIGTVLNIKPVLQIQGGKLDAYKKVRGMKAAIKAIIDGLKEDETVRFKGQKLLIRAAYSGDDSVGEMWQAELQKAFPDYKIEKDPLPLSIACHTGADALGVGIMKDIIR